MNFELKHNEPQPIPSGRYALKVNITSGTVDLQFEMRGEGFTDITDASGFTQSESGILELPACKIQAVISGTATVFIGRTDD